MWFTKLIGVLGFFLMINQASAKDYKKVTERTLFNGDKILEFQLENGMTVLLVPRHQSKLLSYETWFSMGSRTEKLDPKLQHTGLAHLFEHMMFRGTKKYPDGKFDELSSQMGAKNPNASTSFNFTNYYQDIPSDKLESLMELESDRMANLNLTKDLFETEKGAVVGELRRILDSPSSVAFDHLMALSYNVAPYHWTIIGSEEEIKGFRLDQAQYFYNTYYAPNSATLIVVGDTTEQKLMPLVVKYYGGMKRQNIPTIPVPEEPLPTKERKVTITHPQATSPFLLMAYPIPAVTSQDFPALTLLSSHLSTGMEARLRKVLIDPGIAVNASAEVEFEPNLFIVYVELAEKKKPEQAIALIDREISRLKAAPLAKHPLERARNLNLLSAYSNLNKNRNLAHTLGYYQVGCHNYMRSIEILESLPGVVGKDIQAVAKKYLKKQQRSMVFLFPETASKKASSQKISIPKNR